jgi:hypothetical protein
MLPLDSVTGAQCFMAADSNKVFASTNQNVVAAVVRRAQRVYRAGQPGERGDLLTALRGAHGEAVGNCDRTRPASSLAVSLAIDGLLDRLQNLRPKP